MPFQDSTQLPPQSGIIPPTPMNPVVVPQEERLNQILTELRLLRYAMGKLIGEALLEDTMTAARQGDLI